MRLRDLTGKRFGRLVVVGLHCRGGNGKHSRWVCACDCGTENVVSGNSLKRGVTISCGCFQRERASRLGFRHGRYGTPEYRTWQNLIQRCVNQNLPDWKNYGGRGVTVCDRWLNSFEAFLSDMGERPEPKHLYSIDRINNDAHYSCGKCDECRTNHWEMNCRWATAKEQANNRRKAA